MKPTLALASLVGAFYFSISYQYGDPGWQLEFQPKLAEARAESGDDEYDLKSIPILNRAVIQVQDNYVDPSRINERKMIGAAMEEVQRTVAELLVEVERDSEKVPTRLTVRLNGAEATFDLRDVNNLWQMSFKFKDIFKFIQERLRQRDKLAEVEYAAINGMLGTLDPHSVLLRPDEYREMKLSTQGRFGGLGIVISIRDGQLTIVNPIEDTPASRAGLKTGDRVVQIELDSTVNMALSDAVNMLRGEPNTQVDIWVMRDGWKKPRKFTLTRANIRVRSVDYELLADRVGLVRLRHFQHTTYDEVKAALAEMRKGARGRLRGLVMDLRGNPGGLLDQAIKVSNLFIESGPLLTTVGKDSRDPKMATRSGTEPPYPLVVLLDGSSASASEIVAGALKNHHRALMVGQQSFGKGSVQVLYENKDDSALKLTIAQYLTPGDLSIQSVGIVPDVVTRPVVFGEEDTEFYRADEFKSGEVDLPEHLEHESAERSRAQKPLMTVRFLEDQVLRKKIEEHPNDLVVDFDIELARAVVAASKGGTREAMLEEAGKVIEARAAAEAERIAAALAERGIQWTAPETVAEGRPQARVLLQTDHEGDRAAAGETLKITATVENVGDAPFVQLRAVTRSDNELLEGHELVFGTVPPGESRAWSVFAKLPRSALSRVDPMRIEFREANERAPETASMKVAVEQLPRPRFALAWRIDDARHGNGDGVLQLGETAELVLDVQNVGDGKGYKLLSALRNQTGVERDFFIERGRVAHDDGLEVGARTEARFRFKVKDSGEPRLAPLVLSVMDSEIGERTSEKLMLPLYAADLQLQAGQTRLRPRHGDELRLRGASQAGAAVIANAAGAVTADAQVDDWYRVPTEFGFAWVPAAEVEVAAGGPGKTEVRPASPTGPPVIQLGRSPGPETRAEALTLNGEVTGERQVRDLLIFVNNRKVYFKANGPQPAGGLRFSARVPLEQGVNRITVVAREDDEAASRRTVIVTRAE